MCGHDQLQQLHFRENVTLAVDLLHHFLSSSQQWHNNSEKDSNKTDNQQENLCEALQRALRSITICLILLAPQRWKRRSLLILNNLSQRSWNFRQLTRSSVLSSLSRGVYRASQRAAITRKWIRLTTTRHLIDPAVSQSASVCGRVGDLSHSSESEAV